MILEKLEWDEMYSVGVKELDEQHKKMFATINELLGAINNNNPEEHIDHIIDELVNYKRFHFATEEKYFDEFNYEEKDAHKAKHHEFNERLATLQEKHKDKTIEFALELIDFLEDWLISHLMTVDQKYKKCFHDHGLR